MYLYVWSGLVWSGLIWSGLVWSGLVWSGLVWSGLVWSGLVWSGLVCIPFRPFCVHSAIETNSLDFERYMMLNGRNKELPVEPLLLSSLSMYLSFASSRPLKWIHCFYSFFFVVICSPELIKTTKLLSNNLIIVIVLAVKYYYLCYIPDCLPVRKKKKHI